MWFFILRKMSRSKSLYMIVSTIILALAGYFIFLKNSSSENDQGSAQINSQSLGENDSRPVTPEELAEMKKDLSAPSWIKEAESCNWVGKQIFCKLYGE